MVEACYMHLSKSWLIISFSAAFAAVLILQYPLATTFPIGGDATRYIDRVAQVKDAWQQSPRLGIAKLSSNTPYPGVIALLAASELLPGSWPEKFTWWVVWGHVATAAALSWLSYRVAGWQAAAGATVIWSMVTVTITGHVEEGTLAQLLSLGPLALFFSFLNSRRPWPALLLLPLIYVLHPLSGLIGLAVFGIAYFVASGLSFFSLPARLAAAALVLGSFMIWTQAAALANFPQGTRPFPLFDHPSHPFGFFLLLAPAGLVVLTKQIHRQPYLTATIFVFAAVATLLTFNSFLGIGVIPHRLQSYFVMALTILASIALPSMLRLAIPPRVGRYLFVATLFIAFGLSVWSRNSLVFNFYESPSRYARLHPDERAAITWLANEVPTTAFIASSKTNRHSEWIPILSSHQWTGLAANDPIWRLSDTQLQNYIKQSPYTHLVFFKHREKPTDIFHGLAVYPTVYENQAALIVQLQNL
jgi:hypothetical protein